MSAISWSKSCIFKAFFKQLDLFSSLVNRQTTITYLEAAPDLTRIWQRLISSYFPDRQDLENYRIVWSNKAQTRSLASCCVRKKVVRVAKAMSLTESQPYLEALIYHEMCHAVLGPPKIVKRRRIMHGKDFKALERQHPKIKLLDTWIKAGGWSLAVKKDLSRRILTH